jgi:hypothetical protein
MVVIQRHRAHFLSAAVKQAAACLCSVPMCRSPVKEVVYGVRAISPLLVALVLLVVVVLRQPLPVKGFTEDDEADSAHGSESGNGASKDVKDVEHGTDQVRKECCPTVALFCVAVGLHVQLDAPLYLGKPV